MKRYTKYAMALLASFVLALALTACGGGGGGGTSSGGSDSAGGGTDQQQQASFDNITFDIGDISVDIHGSEVVFNAQYEVDVLHLYGTITNNGDEPFNPYDLEVDGMQGTQLLRVAQTRDAALSRKRPVPACVNSHRSASMASVPDRETSIKVRSPAVCRLLARSVPMTAESTAQQTISAVLNGSLFFIL